MPSGGKRLKKSSKAPLIAVACVAGALIVGFAAVCVMAATSTTILHGVDVFGIDFGGQTVEQAGQVLRERVADNENAGAWFRTDEGHETFLRYDELGMMRRERPAKRLAVYLCP